MKYFGVLKLVIGGFVIRASASKSQRRLQFIKTDGKKSLSSCQGNPEPMTDSNNGPKCEEVQVWHLERHAQSFREVEAIITDQNTDTYGSFSLKGIFSHLL